MPVIWLYDIFVYDRQAMSLHGQVTNYNTEIATGQLLSTFLVVQGSVDGLATDFNTANSPTVYFSHMGANLDNKDHVRLLGDNVFGYEDLSGGGDKDFNDIVVKMSFG